MWFRGSITPPARPLSTLRCALTGRQRMTRGQREWLDLRCRALSSPAPCRFIPTLSPIKHHVADPEPTRVADRSKPGRPRAQPAPPTRQRPTQTNTAPPRARPTRGLTAAQRTSKQGSRAAGRSAVFDPDGDPEATRAAGEDGGPVPGEKEIFGSPGAAARRANAVVSGGAPDRRVGAGVGEVAGEGSAVASTTQGPCGALKATVSSSRERIPSLR